MLTEETAIKLILQELGASPDGLKAVSVHNGTIEMYLVYMGRYTVIVTAYDEETLQLTIWRRGQRINTYHDAQTLKEDTTRTDVERRAAQGEMIRNAILKMGIDGCREVIDAWQDICRDELAGAETVAYKKWSDFSGC